MTRLLLLIWLFCLVGNNSIAQHKDVVTPDSDIDNVVNIDDKILELETEITLHKSSGDWKKAYYKLCNLRILKDSIYTSDRNNLIKKINLDLKTALKENQIEILNVENVANAENIKTKKFEQLMYYGGTAVLILLIIALIHRVRAIRKAKELLEVKNKQFLEEKYKAEKSEQFKQSFLANVSHEIRTPMNAIMGISKILLKNKHLKEQEKNLNVMFKSSRELLVLINDILDLSKLEAGKVEFSNSTFNLIEVVDCVMNLLIVKAENKGIKLLSQYDDNIPEQLLGDPDTINQILFNLTRNGISFTEKGVVSIATNVKSFDDDTVVVEFKVRDSGIGIVKEKQEDLLKTFVKVQEKDSVDYEGSGLELAIINRMVELHGGAINLESEPGKGSTFIVEIPFEIKNDMSHSQSGSIDSVLSTTDLDGISILLVEDNEFNVLVAESELNTSIQDLRLDVAGNGQVAIEKLNNNEYDLILMDVQMPVMDGIQATKAIRKRKDSNSKIPIIAMSANDVQQEIDKCLACGMNEYVSKPFDTSELMLKIGTILSQAKSKIVA